MKRKKKENVLWTYGRYTKIIVRDQGSPSEDMSSKLRLPECSEMLKFE